MLHGIAQRASTHIFAGSLSSHFSFLIITSSLSSLAGKSHGLFLQRRKNCPALAITVQSPVFTYSAPREWGAGVIAIHLHFDSPTWTVPTAAKRLDALIACNAGLGSYLLLSMPRTRCASRLRRQGMPSSQQNNSGVCCLQYWLCRRPRWEGAPPHPVQQYSIELSPFHRPGQRPITMYRTPNLVNGFTLMTYKGGTSKRKDNGRWSARDTAQCEIGHAELIELASANCDCTIMHGGLGFFSIRIFWRCPDNLNHA